ncbi:MAG: aldo/keto reductase [Myxococcota bacterium]
MAESQTDHTHLPLSPSLRICRILNGMWQVSGGHGFIDAHHALEEMTRYVDAGLHTWDLADHYGPAEDFIGAWRTQTGRGDDIEAFTKWVPRPGPMPRGTVEAAIEVSRQRMQTHRLDLLQFHWWDYRDKRYLDAMKHLADFQRVGLLAHVGLTNFDTVRTAEIIDAGVPVLTNQVQYSLLDQRPAQEMAPLCAERGVYLLTYGTLAGGLLTRRFLNRSEPARGSLETVSLRKYKRIQEAWGDWSLFQRLLQVLDDIAQRHQVSIANVATAAILERPAVGGVILGARLSIRQHIDDNLRALALQLTDDDRRQIKAVTDHGADLMARIGDCGDEYRHRW